MKLTSKGQVTIPQALRESQGLRPGTEVTFTAAPGGVLIVPAREERLRRLRAAIRKSRSGPKPRFTAEELMRLTRGED